MAADKKLLSALMAKPPPPGAATKMEEEAPVDDVPSDKATAAQDVLDAMKAGDAAGLSAALEAFVGLCSMGGMDEG